MRFEDKIAIVAASLSTAGALVLAAILSLHESHRPKSGIRS
jgi:adenylylsulfate kinase-like enzyme